MSGTYTCSNGGYNQYYYYDQHVHFVLLVLSLPHRYIPRSVDNRALLYIHARSKLVAISIQVAGPRGSVDRSHDFAHSYLRPSYAHFLRPDTPVFEPRMKLLQGFCRKVRASMRMCKTN